MAKEQGLRSRAAFKLTQINRKFPFLEKCQHGILDLCAAPGGWTQIAARTCPKHIPIVAVDILPIRSLGPRVTTLIGDITTGKCQADVRNALQQTKVDAVLHDGAPNVGAEYAKDAYEQNELAIHALKCATQHLLPGGTYCTKVYRSRDYASLQWVLQQLFGSVSAIKPAASRSQSAEIFLVAQYYKAPAKLDPRLLDPKHIFAEVEGNSTGGALSRATGLSVFDKNWGKAKRHRGGYDHEHLDMTMRHIETVRDFVQIPSLNAAIQLLSTSTGLAFTCGQCRDTDANKDKKTKEEQQPDCPCQFLLNHPYTTPEIKECVSDLQVLNQSDFKALLNWRTKVTEALHAQQQVDDEDDDDDDSQASNEGDDDDAGSASEAEEDIQKEIADLRQRRQREKKRQKKKERALAAKRRKKAAMDVLTVDVADHDKVFSLATLASKGDLEAAAHVNLDQMNDEEVFGPASDEEDDSDDDMEDGEQNEERRKERREADLDTAYQMYLEKTKNGLAKSGTKMAKRSKKHQRQKIMMEAAEDQEMAMVNGYADYNTRTYAQLLQGPKDSDDDDDNSSDEENDDGFNADPMTPEEHAQLVKQRKANKAKAESNPLLHKFDDEEPASMKTARWFSNPLFASIGKAAEKDALENEEGYSAESPDDEDDEEDEEVSRPKKKAKKKPGLSAEDVIASMPKTDKQVRHEKRVKALARDERRQARKAKKLGEAEEEFELAPANPDADGESEEEDFSHLSESQKKKILEARALIKAGMGKHTPDDGSNKGIEIVSADELEGPLPRMDDRRYGDEDYDSDDYARTLALGTMMLRRSKEKALVDASYNRYAWNDPEDLPEWFVDDEAKHHRPQLPIPPALIAKMKERQLALSAKPIKKVAEARARKSKRAKAKLVAAKKKSEAVAASSEMSEAMKLKAISKALRGQDSRRPGKSYVVAKKGRAGPGGGGKGVKLVDKRMRSDKRALERKEKKRKKGKQNKLVGSKKRRNHA